MKTVTVDAPAGRIRGLVREGDVAFLGIRYAEAPVAERRFGAPVPARRFGAEYDATALPPACPGVPSDPAGPIVLPDEPSDEDCILGRLAFHF